MSERIWKFGFETTLVLLTISGPVVAAAPPAPAESRYEIVYASYLGGRDNEEAREILS